MGLMVRDLEAQRAAKAAELRSIHEAAGAKEIAGDAKTKFDALDAEIRALDSRIADARRIDEIDRATAGAETRSGTPGDWSRFSIARAVNLRAAGRELDGVEGEVAQELGSRNGSIVVPTSLLIADRRALTTTAPVAGPGGNMVATGLAPVIDRRRPALMVEAMGATVLSGLVGDLDLPQLSASGSAGWHAEHTDGSKTDPEFVTKSMSPKQVSAHYEVSGRLMRQANEAIDMVLMRDLGRLLAQKIDAAAINGGGSNEPVGIIADSAVSETTQADLSIDLTSDMIAALEAADVSGATGFLGNTAVADAARKLVDADGYPMGMEAIFHGERFAATSQVPATLGSGAAPGLIYGDWSSLYVGYWSGVEILVNPYADSVALKGGALLHAFLRADVVVREPSAFTWAAVGAGL